jgi:hypothetical protein
VKQVTFYNSAGQKVAFSDSQATALSFSSAKGPQLANDAKDSTAWRPKTTTYNRGNGCNAGEAAYQVRWSTSHTIVAATAVGLGVGNGGGNSWSGGVQLQASTNGYAWQNVGSQVGSDTVVAEYDQSPYIFSNDD